VSYYSYRCCACKLLLLIIIKTYIKMHKSLRFFIFIYVCPTLLLLYYYYYTFRYNKNRCLPVLNWKGKAGAGKKSLVWSGLIKTRWSLWCQSCTTTADRSDKGLMGKINGGPSCFFIYTSLYNNRTIIPLPRQTSVSVNHTTIPHTESSQKVIY
jgi:hypothetical protein